MNADPALPRLLLLEDDPVSAVFLKTALEGLPAHVDLAGSLAQAEPLRDADHALWLFDANLPDGTGGELLARWRTRGLATPALAHTADARIEEHDALVGMGFAAVILKPLGVTPLQDVVRRHLRLSTPPTFPFDKVFDTALPPIWDDAAALRALNGHAAHVAAMRDLFAGELPATRTRVADAFSRSDVDAMRAELHKLQASCGFVGAARMLATVTALHDVPTCRDAFTRFEDAVEDTLSPGTISP